MNTRLVIKAVSVIFQQRYSIYSIQITSPAFITGPSYYFNVKNGLLLIAELLLNKLIPFPDSCCIFKAFNKGTFNVLQVASPGSGPETPDHKSCAVPLCHLILTKHLVL